MRGFGGYRCWRACLSHMCYGQVLHGMNFSPPALGGLEMPEQVPSPAMMTSFLPTGSLHVWLSLSCWSSVPPMHFWFQRGFQSSVPAAHAWLRLGFQGSVPAVEPLLTRRHFHSHFFLTNETTVPLCFIVLLVVSNFFSHLSVFAVIEALTTPRPALAVR